METTKDNAQELRFNNGDALGDLALKVREAYDKSDRCIRVACEDFTFPDNVVLGGLWDSPLGPIHWMQAVMGALEQVGNLPSGELRAVPNSRYGMGQPYSMCLEYRPTE